MPDPVGVSREVSGPPSGEAVKPAAADMCLKEILRQSVPDWEALRPWLFASGPQANESAAWVLSRLAGVHIYWSLSDGEGRIPPWQLEFLPPGSLPSPTRAMVMELLSRPLPPPSPDAPLQIVGHMSDWLRCGTALSPLVQRNGYALLGRMAQAILPGDRAMEARLLREELVFRYAHTAPLPLQQDILQHLTAYWLTGLRPGSRMPDGELFYGLFFLRQETERISPLRTPAGYHYLQLAESIRQVRPELSSCVPYHEDYGVAAGAGWETLSRLHGPGLSGLLDVLEQKRRPWEPTPLLSRLLELKPDYIESQKDEWRRVLSSLVSWACLPEVHRHHPSARLEVSHFIGQIQSVGLIPDDCTRWLEQLSQQLSPASPPSQVPPCTVRFSPGMTF